MRFTLHSPWLCSILVAACGGQAAPEPEADAHAPAAETIADSTGLEDVQAPADSAPAADIEVEEAFDISMDGTPAPVAGLFDPLHLLRVDIAMSPYDWDALRSETRALFDILGPACLAGPAPDAFSYRQADVTVDGVTLERAGIRKKGFLGSLDVVRPALRIELDEFVAGQRLGDLERLTLNNGKQDPSRLRQCLAYQVFADAGIAAPRCAFASVHVNGDDLGLYIHVEAVKKPFLRKHFGEVIGAPEGALGQLWEGQLSDFRGGWMATFEAKLDDAPADRDVIAAVSTALDAPDETLFETLDPLIDLDAFFAFWAVEVLIAHWDGYAGNTNNFFVYRPAGDDRRLRFIPWGADGTFSGEAPALMATGALAERLFRHREGRSRYVAELTRLLDTVWDEARYIDLIASWDALTYAAREPDPESSASDDVAALKVFVSARRHALEAALRDLPERGPPLREAPCATASGTVEASFATRWNTLPIDDLFATGDGELDLVSEALPPLTFGRVGAKAGSDPQGAPATAQIILAATVVGAGFVALVIELPRPLAPGLVRLGSPAQVLVYYFEPGGDAQLVGFVGDGELVLELAGELLDDGSGQASRIEGRLAGTLYGFF